MEKVARTTKRREIPLNMKARKALLDYLSMRPEIPSDDLFLSQRNEGVQCETIQRAVQRFVKKAEIKNVMPHTPRHRFAKALIDAGVSLEMVATLLGHCNLNTPRFTRTWESKT